MQMRWRWRMSGAVLLATLAMSALFLLFPTWHVLVLLPLGALVYAAGIFAFGPYTVKNWLLLARADRNPS
jgi:ABC-type maltose transport system permease subunit